MYQICALRRHLLSMIGCISLLLPLAACTSTSSGVSSQSRSVQTTNSTATVSTSSPRVIAIHTLAMGGFKPMLVIPGPLGLLMYPPGATGFAGLPSLAFYRYSDQRVETIATAPTEPNGQQGGIVDANYSGDWVSYVSDDSSQSNWALWAFNVTTGKRIQIDSQTNEGSHATWESQTSNAADLVWAFFSGSPTGVTSQLLDYTYASGQQRTLDTSTTALLKPMAMNGSAALIVEVNVTNSNVSTWIQPLAQGDAYKIADVAGVNAWMSSRYAVWDDPHTGTTALFDLTTHQFDAPFANCLRPAISESQPYMVCVQFASDSWLLVHVPDGAETPVDEGKASLGDGEAIYNGRAFFIGPTGDVQYFDLPSQ